MKPSDYQYPSHFTKKHNFVHDRMFHLHNAAAAPMPAWNDPLIFNNSNPVHVEFCSGNGLWIAAKAAAEPDINWVAVEIKMSRSKKIWSKIKNLELPNLFIVYGEGELAAAKFFPQNSVEAIYVNFPDPWPKRHHIKHRLIKPSFVQAIGNLLKPKGSVTIVTDDPGHSEWTLKSFKTSNHFTNVFPAPYYNTEHPNYGTSYFEDLWRSQGCTIRYHQFIFLT